MGGWVHLGAPCSQGGPNWPSHLRCASLGDSGQVAHLELSGRAHGRARRHVALAHRHAHADVWDVVRLQSAAASGLLQLGATWAHLLDWGYPHVRSRARLYVPPGPGLLLTMSTPS